MSKMNYAKIVTPVGVSQFCWLNVPDTKFDETGHYKTNLIVNAKEGQAIVKSINDEVKKAVTIGAEKANGKEVKKANLPFEEEYVEGKPTGNLIFKFKTKAKIITKDGKVIPNKVAIFDSQGKPMTDISIWSGSEMKVSAELIPYFTAMAGAGVSLRLRAVQITKLVEGGNANSAGHGFDKVEDGYVAPEVDKTFENEVQTNTDF
tara:strand:+ start:1730 stop:2344 length:615 start_codon:yes stop_codon:yes gene_type:complete